jgi:hypothetical protein
MPQPSRPTSKKFHSRQILVRFLLVIGSVGLTLLALELVARFLPPPYDPEAGYIFTCHTSLGWLGAPNFQGVFEDGNFRQELIFNSLGMHDTEHTLEKAPDTFRILLLGDSFVQAIQVDEAVSTHQVLEDYLNERAPSGAVRVEVLSSGVVNWGTNQELIYYREQARHFFCRDFRPK